MSDTWYRLDSWQDKIETVEVEKETAHYVTYWSIAWNGDRYKSRSLKAGEFFKTFEEAKQAGIERLKRRISSAQSELDSATNRMRKFAQMEKP